MIDMTEKIIRYRAIVTETYDVQTIAVPADSSDEQILELIATQFDSMHSPLGETETRFDFE